MPVNIDSSKIFNQQKIKESKNVEYSVIGMSDQSESEKTWIKLHQMFDR